MRPYTEFLESSLPREANVAHHSSSSPTSVFQYASDHAPLLTHWLETTLRPLSPGYTGYDQEADGGGPSFVRLKLSSNEVVGKAPGVATVPVAESVASANVVVKVPWTSMTPMPDRVAVPSVVLSVPCTSTTPVPASVAAPKVTDRVPMISDAPAEREISQALVPGSRSATSQAAI